MPSANLPTLLEGPVLADQRRSRTSGFGGTSKIMDRVESTADSQEKESIRADPEQTCGRFKSGPLSSFCKEKKGRSKAALFASLFCDCYGSCMDHALRPCVAA